VEEGRQGHVSLLQSKEITSLLGGGSMETGEFPPCVEDFEVIGRT